jgi:ribokinase/sulfofructose kinase
MADPEERLDLVAVGSAVVDRHYRLSNLPESDGGAFVGDSWRGFGGVAANVAATALRLGRNVGVLTRLGTDRHGAEADAILADLRDRGIHTSRLRRGDEPGAYSIVFVGPDRERMVVAGGESVRLLTLQAAD